MKTYILRYLLPIVVVFCSGSGVLNAQPVEGTIRYLRTQNWAKMMATVDYISQAQRDRMMYMWGNRSEWKTFNTLHIKGNESRYENSEEAAEPGNEGWSDRKETFFMKRNFNNGTLYDAVTFLGKVYLIHDSIVPPAWKILNDMKEVAGHICMNATFTDTLRKQNVLVWFALDMPVSSGPDRFIGLPGLILEVDINNGAVLITADKIDATPLTTELDAPAKIKGKKINMTEYNLLIEKQIKERRAAEEPWFWGINY